MKTRYQAKQYQADHSAALIDNRMHHYVALKQAMIETLAALTPITCRATFDGLISNVKAV